MGKSQQGLVFERILSELQTRITWRQFGDCRVPTAERIVGAYEPYGDEEDYELPGILVSPPKRVIVGGTLNRLDDVGYPFLIQILDRDLNRTNVDRLRSWMSWGEQIRAYFSQGTLRDFAGVNRVRTDQQWIGRKLFRIRRDAVSAVVVVVECREGMDWNHG